jgi:hypothetical protein
MEFVRYVNSEPASRHVILWSPAPASVNRAHHKILGAVKGNGGKLGARDEERKESGPLLQAGADTRTASSTPEVDAARFKEALHGKGRDHRHIGAGRDITQEVSAGDDPAADDKEGDEGIERSELGPDGVEREGERGDDRGVAGGKGGCEGVCPEEGEAVEVLMEEHGRPVSPEDEFQDIDDDAGKGDGEKDKERPTRRGGFPRTEPEEHEEE